MADSDGISTKATLNNYAKVTPPAYVSAANVTVIDGVVRRATQPRNERCACNSGLKYKNCCWRKSPDA